MQINKIGIVGLGFVGNAIYQNIKDKYNTRVYDLDPNKNIDGYLETINSDIIFVCLPTPMTSAEGGDCNISILEKFFLHLPAKMTNGVFVIKSTVPIGTTKLLQSYRRDIKIVHNPEFLTAANAVYDFANSDRNIIGGNLYDCTIVKTFLDELFPNSLNIIVDSNESETIKYFANTFLATKVAYFNLMKDISDKYNMNYAKLAIGVCSDKRIGFSHSSTPGPDGDRGFGGTCFPKDINALIKTFEKNNLNCDILKSVWEYNKQIRKNWDWADNKSAVNGDK
jgi:UDPglucose 6-dehydrogenase